MHIITHGIHNLDKQFSLNDHVSYRRLDQEYLVYSGNTRETLLVDENAYSVILFLQKNYQNYQDISDHLKVKNKEIDELGLSNFLNKTLKQFVECGVISLKQ